MNHIKNMGLPADKLAKIALRLHEAAYVRQEAIDQLQGEDTITLSEAYEVQRQLVDHRVREGHARIGIKMGFTSRAKMVQMGLSDLIWGQLTSDMLFEEGGNLSLRQFVHPRVEPEICFLLKRALPEKVTAAEALAAVEAVAPAMEIIDSRYKNFKFSLPDVVADNASSAGLIIGSWFSPQTDFSNLGLILSANGRALELGSTAAILGHPIRSLVSAARMAAQANTPLQAGDLVMAGGATAAVSIPANTTISCEMQGMGKISFHTKD